MNVIIGNGNANPSGTPATSSGDGAAGAIDVDTEGFMSAVIEGSARQPVIVDFWAPWCGPCKQLAPMLEKVVAETRGKVRLVKVNVDENQELAGQLRVQSIPMVYAFFQGRPVDGFAGAVPESQLRSFVAKLTALADDNAGDGEDDSVEGRLAAAREAMKAGEDARAMQLFTQILEADGTHVEALAGLARCYLNADEPEAARGLISEVPADKLDHPEVAAVHSALELAQAAAEAGAASGGIAGLEQRIAADPADHQARFDLALAHFAANNRDAATDQLIEILRRKRDWNEGAARVQLLKMFEAWGSEAPATLEGRQRLSSVLFS